MSLSPIDRAKTDSPFSADPTQSFTMPARYYTDDAVYQKERDAIYFSNWWYVGHSSQVAERGEYITASIDNQNIFVVADENHELRGFYNVCQHRGHELLEGVGQTNMIRCPYHAWAYDLHGSLKSARNTRNVPGFDKCEFSLKTIRVETFCGMVFVNLDNDAAPLASLASELNQDNGAFSFEKGDVEFGFAGWYLWPNLTIWVYPGEANLSILQMNPNGATKTLEFQDWFVRDGKPTTQLKEAMDYQKDVLQPEDIRLCESVQRGLNSRGYNQGRFVVDTERTELSEHAVHHFQEMVVNALGANLT